VQHERLQAEKGKPEGAQAFVLTSIRDAGEQALVRPQLQPPEGEKANRRAHKKTAHF